VGGDVKLTFFRAYEETSLKLAIIYSIKVIAAQTVYTWISDAERLSVAPALPRTENAF
jgi:hypothetical protein